MPCVWFAIFRQCRKRQQSYTLPKVWLVWRVYQTERDKGDGLMETDKNQKTGKPVETDELVKKIMAQTTAEMNDLMEKLTKLSNNSYLVTEKLRENSYKPKDVARIFEGDYTMKLIGGDVVHPKAIWVKLPPYHAGEYSRYFSFRLDIPNSKLQNWGDAEWYTSSPDCFTELKNGNNTLTVKMLKKSTKYTLTLADGAD